MYRQLCGEYESMDKSIQRSTYTRRIQEIVSNIKKLREEVTKVRWLGCLSL